MSLKHHILTDDVWDKFLQEINPNGVVVADVTTPEPPVYDCDPPYVS